MHNREGLDLIETRWQRGPSWEWKSYDFEKLSDDIFEATGVSLSELTLKRLFGKVAYNNPPSVQTLNTLARFAGFKDWSAFKWQAPMQPAAATAQQVVIPAQVIAATAPAAATAPKKRVLWWPFLFLPLGALAYLFLNSTRISRHIPVNPSAFSFSSNKVRTEG